MDVHPESAALRCVVKQFLTGMGQCYAQGNLEITLGTGTQHPNQKNARENPSPQARCSQAWRGAGGQHQLVATLLRERKNLTVLPLQLVEAGVPTPKTKQQKEKQFDELNTCKALAIDLGVNNLVTAVTSTGESFIIDGRRLKSVNQWYNKENARLQRIKSKQGISYMTGRQKLLARKHRCRVDDYMSKVARYVVDYCVGHDIGVLVLGYNKDFKNKCCLGACNNQNFSMIPFGRLRAKLAYLCELVGVRFVIQEESYTSRASFWDQDVMPVYGQKSTSAGSFAGSFSGVRVFRGLFCTGSGVLLNADVNGALNILRKSNVVSLETLYARGVVDTPARIRVT